MNPEIDAEGIWQLVRDWPADAKPKYLRLWTATGTPCFLDTNHVKYENEVVYHAFVGSGLVWLVKQSGTRSVTHTDSDNAITKWCVYDTVNGRMRWGEELLHAVASAVLAAKGGVS